MPPSVCARTPATAPADCGSARASSSAIQEVSLVRKANLRRVSPSHAICNRRLGLPQCALSLESAQRRRDAARETVEVGRRRVAGEGERARGAPGLQVEVVAGAVDEQGIGDEVAE
jgi:hypothetical protein